ncbi:peptidoglycan-binding protein [Bradyrhizobium sp. AUGA SZCCT0176]|uniref:peptidoglycan-binding domain-containing protein n=1 Tax=Bradyrhizobium sp. AUGA SZCCT0176 TaxID=2807664 RepID=UPI001BA9C856|nr:peptidoglycan-binding domain-containing protein [Bradyrhizobium sp. AUGA SZCCT0176]MBR1230195.1 peptidoglycan-binding protein [Bradyrhizobium sp. AUGA SZCCT0176]
MSWRLARALEKLRSQVNAKWPKRGKGSDGSVGDTSHGARKSDHNPDGAGIVHAIDITHDPKNGFDSYAFADMLLAKQDPRVSYIISNRRIGSGPKGPQPGKWRKYTGSNAHDHHVHISVVSGAKADDIKAWDIGGLPDVAPEVVAAYIKPPRTLRKGSTGEDVKKLQKALKLTVDGKFGALTEAALKKFQTAHKLAADGVAGPQTWAALN